MFVAWVIPQSNTYFSTQYPSRYRDINSETQYITPLVPTRVCSGEKNLQDIEKKECERKPVNVPSSDLSLAER